MSTDNKEDSNSQQSDKLEEDSSKDDLHRANDSSNDTECKDNAKEDKKENSEKKSEKVESDKDEIVKEKSTKNEKKKSDDENKDKESDKEENEKEVSSKGSEKDDSEDDEESDEERVGILDRPVQVTGCRARKQVQRLEVSFNTPSKEIQIPEGKGKKLGEIPLIEQQISKHALNDLKPLHRILYSRVGSAHEIKKNIRKFSGFAFQKNSPDFGTKRAFLLKFTNKVLLTICDILILDKSKTKDDRIERILDFLMCPKDSGKKPPKKRIIGQDKKKGNSKKTKSNAKKAKPKASEKDVVSSASEASNDNASGDNEESDSETNKKSKGKKKPKAKIAAAKTGKPKNEPEKVTKRKRDVDSDSEIEEVEEPPAKKSKIPDDDEIVKLVEKILEKADLQEITMKKVIKQVFDTYPECDLLHKKAFIKKTIKSVIS